MSETEPNLLVLPRREYRARLDKDLPGWRARAWWHRLGRRFGREWWPHAHYHAPSHTVIVERGYERGVWGRRRLAHEYGHAIGKRHPPVRSVAYWTDVMGYGPRVLDHHDLVRRSEAWRGRHGLA